MDVGLDEARADQPAAGLAPASFAVPPRPERDGGDAPVLHADVGRPADPAWLSGSRTSRSTRSKSIETALFAIGMPGTHVAVCILAFIAFRRIGHAVSPALRGSRCPCRSRRVPGIAAAQTRWPSKPIRWIVNFPPAGAADILSRTLAEWFGSGSASRSWSRTSPAPAACWAPTSSPRRRGDAHVVMMSSAASHGIGPVLYKDVPYDPLADFTHIHLVGTFPSVLAVNGASPITSVQAADRPGARQARRDHLRLGRQRHDEPSRRPVAGARDRHAVDAHPLSRLGAGDERSDGRPDRGADGKPADGDRLLQFGAHAAACA